LLKQLWFICSIIFFIHTAAAQSGCAINGIAGQTTRTAIKLCNTNTIIQDLVPLCENYKLPLVSCAFDGKEYKDKNPFWYQLTCSNSGTFGFTITPKNITDDYNWQFFDITNHASGEIYTDVALFAAANWSGTTGITGASSSGANSTECASAATANVSTFSKIPELVQGRTYLLMVSHNNDAPQSGYTLSFNGSATIAGPALPSLQSANANCDGTEIYVKFTTAINCASLAANGSDFEIPGFPSAINSAIGIGCIVGGVMDSVLINLSAPLPPGNYALTVKSGSDNNSLLDNCSNTIPAGTSVPFSVYGLQPAALDSIIPPPCSPVMLQVFFKKNIQCSSVAPDGTDFAITGPSAVTILSAATNCTNSAADIISLQLAAPIVRAGIYTITLLRGSDNNALTDVCGIETPAGSSINFTVNDTVNAGFTYQLIKGCRFDTIHYFSNAQTGITTWNWRFDNTQTSTAQNPVIIYNSPGEKTTQLIAGNGFCNDTSIVKFTLSRDPLKASFSVPAIYCPNDIVYFKDSSTGNIINWYWQFGNGFSSNLQNPPPQAYAAAQRDRLFPVQLIIESDKFCYDTVINYLKAAGNCYISVPTAFTPNKDGLNDYLYPLNAYRAAGLEFKVFNKFGMQLFARKDRTRKWDGTFNGAAQPPGVYIWFLHYTNTETGKKIFEKGTTVLIR